MPRQARLDAPGTLHHVMARGIERRKIFLTAADYQDFVRRLEAVVVSTGVRVFAWALLPNHFHLLLETGEVPLSTVMRRVMTGYAGAFNRRHRRHGHLFQNRYKSIVCEREVLHRSAGAWFDLPTRKGQWEAVVHDERVLGDPEFVADLLADADWERRQLLKARTRTDIAELAQHVARLGKISVEQLRGGGRQRRVVTARAALAQVAIGEFGHTGAVLARYLGVAPSTVNRKAVDDDRSPLVRRLLEAPSR